MSLDMQNKDPGPRAATLWGLAIGVTFGFFVGLVGFDFSSFEFGKWVGTRAVERKIDTAVDEAAFFRKTGYHNLQDVIRAYEEREEVALALRQFEAEFLQERAALLAELH